MLRTPKYTGYQAWNRGAPKKGHDRTNPPETWVWSEELGHPAIVHREEYYVVQVRAKANARSRQGVPATVARPTAKRDYLYRGLHRSGICGLRKWGDHRRNSTYYSCQPSHQRSKDIPVDHPPHVYLNEQRLSDALLPFLATALFGPERTSYWRACLEADDVTPALRRRVGQRVAELEDAVTERRERLAALARALSTEAPTLADVAPLLDRLPDPRHLARRGAPGRTTGTVRLATARRRLPAGRGRRRCRSHPLRSWRLRRPDGGAGPRGGLVGSAPPAGAGLVLRRVVRLSRRLQVGRLRCNEDCRSSKPSPRRRLTSTP